MKKENTGEDARMQVPPPQRGKDDDPTKAYTKAPDYGDNARA